MECLYISNLNENTEKIQLDEAESKHTKSLRIHVGDRILATNGEGLTALCELDEISKKGNTVRCLEFYNNYNELSIDITIAVGILENSDRFEFIIEKSVELGAKEIVPLITKHSSDKPVRYERAVSKSIAALKQSKRSILPLYSEPVYLSQLYDKFHNWDCVILADEKGASSLDLKNYKKILIICGPEGGFSDEEILFMYKAENLQKVKIGNSRLRSETAAIGALTLAVFNSK